MPITVNTYARLEKPVQFRPSEAVDFTVFYSDDLSPSYATLTFFGGSYGFINYINGHLYKKTQYANTSIGGQRFETFEVPAYAIGLEPYEETWSIMLHSGTLQAKVEFGSELDEEGNVANPVFTSNAILVPIYLAPEHPLAWDDIITPSNIADSSVFKKNIKYRYYSARSPKGIGNVNSYRYFLYDSDENLVWDSGTKYDWSTTEYTGIPLKFAGLEDDSVYYYKCKATLVGGYNVETPLKQVDVAYVEEPISPSILKLKNNQKGYVEVETNVSATHTKFIISRCIKNTNQYLTVKTRNASNNYTFKDYMTIPNITYTYKLAVFNGDILVGTYYNEITHSLSGICIADSAGAYQAVADVVKYPVSKNARSVFQDTMGGKYTYEIINGDADYHTSGSTQGTFISTENECGVTQADINAGNIDYSHQMLNWLNNGKAKLLKYDDGFAAIIGIDGEPSLSPDDSKKLYTCSFGWKEIADKDDTDNYTELGLVGDV